MIADLHAHYAMHLLPEDAPGTVELMGTAAQRLRRRDRLRARIVALLGRFANYQSLESGPRVTLPLLRAGNVRVVLSVLYSPFDEMDLQVRYGAPPRPDYLGFGRAPARARGARPRPEPRGHCRRGARPRGARATAGGRQAGVPSLRRGRLPPGRDRRRGRARRQRARAPRRRLRHPRAPLLAPGGDQRAGDPVLARLALPPALPAGPPGPHGARAGRRPGDGARAGADRPRPHECARARRDAHAPRRARPERRVPVLATHAGYRFGRQEYMLDRGALKRIAARDGVVGLIFAEHQILDGLRRRPTKSFEQAFEVLCRHIERIRELTGSHRHAAIGSDLDGFIKPTLAGLQSMADMASLESALAERYGEADAALICSDNALRLLRSYWRSGGGGQG